MDIFGRCLLSLAWFWQNMCPSPIRPARTSLDTLSVLRKHCPINCSSWCILKIFTFPWVRDSAIFRRHVSWLRLVCTKNVWVTQLCPTLSDPTHSGPPGWPLCPWNSAGKNTVGFRSNSTPRMEWVAIPFSRGSSQPRDGSWVSCIVGRFFTIWDTREVLVCDKAHWIKSKTTGFQFSLWKSILTILMI